MNLLPSRRPIALAIAALATFALLQRASVGQELSCDSCNPPRPVVYLRHATIVPAEPAAPSWIFRPSTYTHDPATGARVAQYEPLPSIEPLEDQRLVTSRYHRSRTNLRGADGSIDTYYEVQQWGNGRGGLDAEWERFHDAWKESILAGGYYNQGPNGYGAPYGGQGYGGGFGYGAGYGAGYGYGAPGNGYPGTGFIPGYGQSGYGMPGYGNPSGNGGWQHGGPGGGPPHDQSHDQQHDHSHDGDGHQQHND